MINNTGNIHQVLRIQQALRSFSSNSESSAADLGPTLGTALEVFDCSDGRIVLSNPSLEEDILIEVIEDGVSTRVGPASQYEKLGAEAGAIKSSTARNIDNTLEISDWNPGAHRFTAEMPSSAVIAPFSYHDNGVGAITLMKRGIGQFDEQDLLLLTYFAAQLEDALTAVQLRRALRSAAHNPKGTFEDNHDLAAILVHDLQGPLANVITSLEMVQETMGQSPDAALAPIVEIAIRSSQQLQDLVDSLLDIGRLEAGHGVIDLESVTVCDLVDYVTDIVSPLIEQRQVNLDHDIAPELPNVMVNEGVIQRVLLNLLDNALKVSKRSQTITVRAAVEAGGQFVRICVEDQGPGIPHKFSQRVFEKYQRIPGASSSKGLGLGLAFCRLAVEAHGGRIWIKNTGGEGACFCFTVPRADQGAGRS